MTPLLFDIQTPIGAHEVWRATRKTLHWQFLFHFEVTAISLGILVRFQWDRSVLDHGITYCCGLEGTLYPASTTLPWAPPTRLEQTLHSLRKMVQGQKKKARQTAGKKWNELCMWEPEENCSRGHQRYMVNQCNKAPDEILEQDHGMVCLGETLKGHPVHSSALSRSFFK